MDGTVTGTFPDRQRNWHGIGTPDALPGNSVWTRLAGIRKNPAKANRPDLSDYKPSLIPQH